MKKIGMLTKIFISSEAGGLMKEIAEANLLEGAGIEGDRYAQKVGFWQTNGKNRESIRDVTLIKQQDVEKTNFAVNETRRNLLVNFIDPDLNLVHHVGSILIIGEARLKIVEDCTPCNRPSQIAQKPHFAQEFKGIGGVRCQVIKGAQISPQMDVFLLHLIDLYTNFCDIGGKGKQ